MDDLFLLTKVQMRRIEPYFPLSHGVPRVDDRRVLSGIIFVIRNGLQMVLANLASACLQREDHAVFAHHNRSAISASAETPNTILLRVSITVTSYYSCHHV
jgi:hypothetical protein